MQSHSNSVQNARGDVLQGAVVSVYLAGTETLATIYSDNGITAITNPITAGQDGSFQFWAANGRYDITSVYGTSTDTYEIILFDSEGITSTASELNILDGVTATASELNILDNDVTTGVINLNKGSDIASATTTDIGAATGNFVDITGTTTITGFGTVKAGTKRTVQFDGSLTLTYNATSMILPGNANIVTQAGDVAEFISLGSGNWLCSKYTKDLYSPVSGMLVQTVEATPYTTYSSHTTVFPIDDTIPQNTEGEEIITVTITPKSASNRLRIEANISTASVAGTGAFALFKDADADAIAVTYTPVTYVLRDLVHEMAAGTTSAITFKLRAGPATGGTIYLNGSSSARYFGGIAAVRLRVDEIAV